MLIALRICGTKTTTFHFFVVIFCKLLWSVCIQCI